jgi:hypothetical protein
MSNANLMLHWKLAFHVEKWKSNPDQHSLPAKPSRLAPTVIDYVRFGLRIQPVVATLPLLAQSLVCCNDRLNPQSKADMVWCTGNSGTKRSRPRYLFGL